MLSIRPRILAGLLLGALVGAGLVTAVSENSAPPLWRLYLIFCGGVGSLGMMGGSIAGFNALSEQKPQSGASGPILSEVPAAQRSENSDAV